MDNDLQKKKKCQLTGHISPQHILSEKKGDNYQGHRILTHSGFSTVLRLFLA